MPTFTIRRVMVANETVDNIFAGSVYEYIPWPAQLELGVAGDATGVLATVSSGSDILGEEQPIAVKAINTIPVYPDDFQFFDEAMTGDRLKVRVRDTSGAARTVMAVLRLTPL